MMLTVWLAMWWAGRLRAAISALTGDLIETQLTALERMAAAEKKLDAVLGELVGIRDALTRGFEVAREGGPIPYETTLQELPGLAQAIFTLLPRRVGELLDAFRFESRESITEQLHKLQAAGLVWQDASKRWRRTGKGGPPDG